MTATTTIAKTRQADRNPFAIGEKVVVKHANSPCIVGARGEVIRHHGTFAAVSINGQRWIVACRGLVADRDPNRPIWLWPLVSTVSNALLKGGDATESAQYAYRPRLGQETRKASVSA